MKKKNKKQFKYGAGSQAYLPEIGLVDLLCEAFKKYSNQKAAVCGDIFMNYQQLDLKSNAIADILCTQSVGKGDIIFVEMESSIELLVSLLGILKVGAVYIPIDPAWSIIKRRNITKNIDPKIILTDKFVVNDEKTKKIFTIDIEALPYSYISHSVKIKAMDPVYGLFTSGSTGVPKCAINTNIGLLNRLLYMNKRYIFTNEDVVLQNSKCNFDASLWQLLWPLINGGLVVIPYKGENFVPESCVELIEKYNVTITDFVPSIFSYFVAFFLQNNKNLKLQSLRQILMGGEAMDFTDVATFKKLFPHVGITNTYGPTECSIGTIFYEIPDDVPKKIPIGQPIDNVSVAILDEDMKQVNVGEVGEIYLGGVCVGLGYSNDKKKTEQVFLKNIFYDFLGSFLYKTGDFGVYLANGDIEFRGRKDRQIKINGVRIELGEIENRLKRNSNVKTAVCFFEDIGNDKKELVAFIVVKKKRLNKEAVLLWSNKNLPAHLVPNKINIIKEIPLTSIGKIDRKQILENLYID